jgi:hypothetical protein
MMAGTSKIIGGMMIGIGFTPFDDEESTLALQLRSGRLSYPYIFLGGYIE